jgi:hypothetical protein
MVLYLALLPLWWYSLPMLTALSGTIANWLYRLFDPRISIVPDGRLVRILVAAPALTEAQTNSPALRLDTMTYGLPMLAALVIVTHADSVLAKLRALLLGLGVMAALTVPVMMAWAKLISIEIDEKMTVASGDRSSLMFDVMHGYAFCQPVVAVIVWMALMMLGLFEQSPTQNTQVSAPPRNAPCPCGSGRKFKRCCGRVSS